MSIVLGNIGNVSVKEAITAIYVGYFDRAPDPSGLDYWIGRFQEFENGTGGADIDAGLSLQDIATSFSQQTESRVEYPFFETPNVASATAFIIQVYANLFNRAPDQEGQDYWVNELVSGNQPVGSIILSIISGAQNDANGQDITTVQHKIEIGCDWVQHAADAGINADPFTDDPEAVAGAKAALNGVNDTDASVVAAEAATDAFFAGYGNDAPVATTTAATANEDAVLNGFVESTDADAGDTATFSVAANATTSNGTLVMNTDGSYVYTPNADFVGTDSFTYTVKDAAGETGTSTVVITVNNTNDAPVAGNVIAVTSEDNGIVVTPVSTDIDAGDTATYSVGSNPSNGSVVANANGTFTYTPNANFNGTDSFQYIVTDAAGATSIATATVTVTAVDDAPVAANSATSATEGAAVVSGSVSATDIDSASISFALDAAAPAGLTFNNNGSFSFDPTSPAYNYLDAGDVATITVGFTAAADGQSDGGVLTITVTGTNDVPTASAVTANGSEDGGAITVTPIVADLDADDTATLSITAAASNGTVVVNANGTFSYTPNANFNGTDTFQYTVTDSQGATASATATVVVASVNDAPVLANETVSTFEDQAISGQLTGTDVDGDALAYAVTDGVDNGTLVFNANGSYTYTPNGDFNGSDAFTVSVSDSNGGTDTALVTISITAVDDVLTTAIDDISGGAADDLFLANGQTLNPGDSIDGGEGDDTLFVASTGPTNLTAFLTSNLENIIFTHDSAGGVAGAERLNVDLSSTSGVEKITVENSFRDIDLRFMEGNDVTLDNLTQTVNTLIDGRNNELLGGADNLNLTVRNSMTTTPSTGDINIDAAYETVNLDTQGATGPVSISDLNTDVNTDGGSPTTPALGARTLNIDADDASLTIGDSDAGGITRTATDAVIGIDNPLSANVSIVDASDSTQSVSFSVADANNNTTLRGGSAGDNIEGSAFADVISGNDGNDNIAGEGGNDNIFGGEGNDWITGQAGNDNIDGGAGSDNLYGNAGNDSILGGTGGDIIDTGTFADGAGTEFVDAGDDRDDVYTRGDFLNGRATAGTSLTPNGVGATNNVDQLDGGDGLDTLIVRGNSADTSGLNDVQAFEAVNLESGTFDFTIGNNSVFENDHDARVAAAGTDGYTIISGRFSTATDVDASTLDEAITLRGGNGDDELIGGRGNDTIEGDGSSGIDDGGDDLLLGGAGDDTFITNANELNGGDTIEGDSGSDTIVIDTDNGRTSGVAASSGNAAVINGNVNGIQTIKVEDNSDTTDEGDLTINFTGFTNTGDANATTHDGAAAGTDDTRLIVDGSDMDAGESLTVNMAGNGVDEDISVLGGAGNDEFTFGALLDSGDAIDGGAGFDNVTITASSAGDFTNVSNIECITVSGMTAPGTLVFGADAEAAFAAGVTPIIKLAAGSDGLTIDTRGFVGPVIIEDNNGDHTFLTGGAGDVNGSGADTIIAAGGTDTYVTGEGEDVIIVSGGDLDATDSLNMGADNDTVQMDNSTGAVTAVSNLDTNSTVENYVLTDDGDRFVGNDFDNNTLTFLNGNVNTLTEINVDATALTDPQDSFRVTLDASQQDADFAFNVEGSSTADTFEKRNDGVDNNIDFNAGDGSDNFILNGGDAGSTTAYDGGAGFDQVTLSGGTITDDGFVAMENIEGLNSETGVALVAQLGAEADRANSSGTLRITGSDLGDDVVTDSQFNNGVVADIGLGDDKFDFSASSGTVTFSARPSEIDANDTLKGGTGAVDRIFLLADNGTADLSNMTGVETIIVSENGDNSATLIITDNTFTDVADNEIDVDASALNDTGIALPEGSLTLNAGGVTTGILDVIGGTGDDNITTGGGADTVASGDGDDVVNTGAGADTALLGAGNDAANTGAGADVVDAGTGNDTVDAGAGDDVVDGGTGNDIITGGNHDTDYGERLTGGGGNDQFRYVNIDDSRLLVRDVITDFNDDGADVITIETQLIHQSILEARALLPLIPDNLSLTTPFDPAAGINFAGVAVNFSDAQGAVSANTGDGKADYVIELNAGLNGEAKLWIDVNDDGILNGRDIQIFLEGVVAGDFNGDEVLIIDTIAPTISDVALSVTETDLTVDTVTADFDQNAVGNETDVYEGLTGTDTTLEGTLDGIDTDGTAVTYTDVNGTAPVAGVITVVGTYGTLTVDEVTGAYTYEAGDTAGQRTAIEALDDLDTPTDDFTVEVTDNNSNTATGTISVTVNGSDDHPVIVTGGGTTSFTEDTTFPALAGTLVATDVDTGTDAVVGDEVGDTVVFNIIAGGETELPNGFFAIHQVTGPDLAGDATIEGAYGTLSINVNTGVYSYAPEATAAQVTNVQQLAEGETHNETFNIDVFDGDDAGAVTTAITATWVGVNDAPVITVVTVDNGDLTENDISPMLTFVLNVADTDYDDTVDMTVGTSPTLGGTGAAAATAAGFTGDNLVNPLTGNVAANPTAGNNITYTFDAGGETFDFLAEGEVLEMVYTVTATDTSGAANDTDTQTITVRVEGTDDNPTIDVVLANGDTDAAAFAEDANSPSAANLTATGTLTAVDADVSDVLTISITPLAQGGTAAGKIASATTDAMLDAFDTAGGTGDVTVDGDTGASSNSNVTWSFDSGAETFDALRQGETLILSYQVVVSDGAGPVGTETVDITITGTNDVVTIVSDTNVALLEVAGDSSTQLIDEDGIITVNDLDVGDPLTATVTSITATSNGGAVPVVPGVVDVTPLTATPTVTFEAGVLSNGGDQTIGYDYDVASVDLDWIRQGETVTVTVDYAVTDGLTVPSPTDSFDIVITGENDEVVIDTVVDATYDENNVPGTSSELDVVSVGGTVSVTDQDLGDTLTFSTPGAATLTWNDGSTNFTGPAAIAAAQAADDLAGGSPLSIALLSNLLGQGNLSFTGPLLSNGGSANVSTWTYNGGGLSDIDWLKAGETLTVSYAVQVTDGFSTATTTETIDIVISGTDDPTGVVSVTALPVVFESQTDTDFVDDSARDLDPLMGTITIEDQDVGQDLTFTVNALTTVNYSAGAIPGSVDISALIASGALTLAAGTVTTTGEFATLGFTYDPAAADLDWLNDGEILSIAFTVDITGGAVPTTATVTVQIQGTNDAPVLAAADVTGAVTETVGLPTDPLTDTGTITFTDPDLYDTPHTAVASAATSGALPGPLGGNGTLTANVTSETNDTDGTGGVVTWNYSVDANLVEYLAVGETVQETFTITLTDSEAAAAGTDTQTVTVTITGTNDLPVFLLQGTDTAGAPLTETNGFLAANGTVTVTDVDISDDVDVPEASVTVAATGVTTGGLTNAQLLAMFTMDEVDLDADGLSDGTVTAPTTPGNVAWDFDSSGGSAGAGAFDYLNDGETLTITYTMTGIDNNGATDTQDITIVITGTDDAAVVDAGAVISGAVTELPDGDAAENTATFSESGAITFSDVDLTDSLGMTFANQTNMLGSLSLSHVPGNPTTGTWTNFGLNNLLNFLAEGETQTGTFDVITTSTGSETTTQTVTVVYTGANDGPSFVAGSDVAETFSEDDASFATSGFATVTDEDTSDVVDVDNAFTTVGTTGFAGTLTPAQLLAMFSVAENNLPATTGDTDNVAWSFDTSAVFPGGDPFGYLAATEQLIITYTMTADDDNGGTDTTDVVITVTGADDAPVVSGGVFAATINELADGEAGEGLVTTTYAPFVSAQFTDPDTNDVITVSNPTTSVLPPYTGLSTSTPAPSNPSGTLVRTYFSNEAAMDYLAEGETAIFTSTFTGTGTGGLAVTQDGVVTFVGANDGPEVTTAATVAGTSITFEVSDVDLIDTVSLVGGAINGTDATKGNGNVDVAGQTVITAISQGVATTDAIQVQDNNGATTAILLNLTQGTAGGDVLGVTANGVAGAVFGFGGDDTITGSAFDDTIDGGADDDTITGGEGADELTGSGGADTFVFDGGLATFGGGLTSNDENNVITDFGTGGSDLIDFVTNGAAGGGVTAGNFAAKALNGAGSTMTDGFTFVTDGSGTASTAASLSDADVAAFLLDVDGTTVGNQSFTYAGSGDAGYIAVTDGTDLGIFAVSNTGGGAAPILVTDLEIIVTLQGVTSITAADLVDFI